MPNPCRIVFMGTPGFAVPALEALVASPHQVVAVVTAPDKSSGRGMQINVSAVKQFATDNNIGVLQPVNLRSEDFLSHLRVLEADIFVVVAFRKLPSEVWQIPKLGTFNLHASLLPNYRGAAPIQRALMNGETLSGLTTFLIDDQIDTGKIILRKPMPIFPDEDAGSLHDRMMTEGAVMVLDTVDLIADGNVQFIDQSEFQTPHDSLKPAPKIHKEDCRINWQRPWRELLNQIRALSPFPAAFTTLQSKDGTELNFKIIKAGAAAHTKASAPGSIDSDGKSWMCIACADGWIDCEVVQLEGKRRMTIPEFLRGYPVTKFPKAY